MSRLESKSSDVSPTLPALFLNVHFHIFKHSSTSIQNKQNILGMSNKFHNLDVLQPEDPWKLDIFKPHDSSSSQPDD